MDLRDVSTLTVARAGRLETTTTVIGLRLVDGANEEILPASQFLSSLLASGASQPLLT